MSVNRSKIGAVVACSEAANIIFLMQLLYEPLFATWADKKTRNKK